MIEIVRNLPKLDGNSQSNVIGSWESNIKLNGRMQIMSYENMNEQNVDCVMLGLL